MPTHKFQTSDKKMIDVDTEVACYFGALKTMLENLGSSPSVPGDDENPIVLDKINEVTLRSVIKWVEHHKDDPPSAEDDDCNEICTFDTKFLDVDESTLCELVLAANYLDIKGLLNLTSKRVASMIEGKSTEDMRRMFNVKKDFAPVEEELVLRENEWCVEK